MALVEPAVGDDIPASVIRDDRSRSEYRIPNSAFEAPVPILSLENCTLAKDYRPAQPKRRFIPVASIPEELILETYPEKVPSPHSDIYLKKAVLECVGRSSAHARPEEYWQWPPYLIIASFIIAIATQVLDYTSYLLRQLLPLSKYLCTELWHCTNALVQEKKLNVNSYLRIFGLGGLTGITGVIYGLLYLTNLLLNWFTEPLFDPSATRKTRQYDQEPPTIKDSRSDL